MNNPQTAPGANVPSANGGGPTPLPQNPPAHQEHHRGTWILVILIIVVAVAAIYLLSGKKPKPPAPPPVSITVTNVWKGDIDVAVSSLGSVQPVYTASMSPRVDGQVVAVNFIEGQMVKSNDLLVEIDPGPYQAAVTQAQGQLQRDKALLEGANVDLKRYEAAAAKNAVPKQQVDDEVALVHQDEGLVKFDEGQLEAAKVNLAYCYIRAPFEGRVGLRLVDPGNVVHAANTNAIVVVAQLQPITVVFNVAEDYLPQIMQRMGAGAPGKRPTIEEQPSAETPDPAPAPRAMAVEAWDRAQEHKIATGKVLALNNLIDTATGTIRFKAMFDNEDLSLFPNQFVNANLVIQTLHGQSLLPTFAIQHNPEGAFVYVVTNSTLTTNGTVTNYQTVTMRTIVPGTADTSITAVQGVEAGEVIALDNFNKLGEGVRVAPKQPAGQSRGGGGKHKGGAPKPKPDDAKDSP
ncbi:MAG: efflux RND transporter periplasmic adaptor subunit [Verrucomicrobiota bacterium]|jgi:multidrug efflux system membrane fusion protein